MSKSWYGFIWGDPSKAESYVKMKNKHECLCGNAICAIYARGIEHHPDTPFSANLQQYIKDALVTGELQPQDPFDAKKYVYLKH